MTQVCIPPYFSWIVDKLLAVSALPFHHTHLNYYADNGIQTIVSIADDIEPPFHTKQGLKVIHLNTVSTRAPSLNECMYFVSLIENAKRRREGVLVHSVKGKGRAATLIACYLVKAWECPADYVINHLRVIRPVSIESKEQENVIFQFHDNVCAGFEGFYSKIQIKWDPKTEFLGKDENTFGIDQPISESFLQRELKPENEYLGQN